LRNVQFIISILAVITLGTKTAMAYEITSKKQFLDEIAGRKLVQEDSWVIISPDGKVTGKGPGNGMIVGAWVWDDVYYCRKIVIDGEPLPRNCQVVTRDGDTVSFFHDKGAGIVISWHIE